MGIKFLDELPSFQSDAALLHRNLERNEDGSGGISDGEWGIASSYAMWFVARKSLVYQDMTPTSEVVRELENHQWLGEVANEDSEEMIALPYGGWVMRGSLVLYQEVIT